MKIRDRYLFKAKRLDNGEWVQGSYLYDYGRDIHYIFANEIACPNCINDRRKDFSLQDYEIDPSTLCHCTGMRDKNDKLIWENDILDGFIYPYMSDGVHNYYVEVCWCANVPSFGIYTQKYPESKVAGISAGMTELMEDWDSNDWEVIGNIFDNQELSESEG